MKLKQLSLVVAFGFFSTCAMAEVFNIDVIGGTTSFNHANLRRGAFTDTFNFNVAGLASVDGLLSNLASNPSRNIDFTSASLNGTSLDISNSGNLSLATLLPATFTGPLQLIVNGISGGNSSYSGNLNITALTTVPEPESYALMLAGLGLVGFAARRNKNKA